MQPEGDTDFAENFRLAHCLASMLQSTAAHSCAAIASVHARNILLAHRKHVHCQLNSTHGQRSIYARIVNKHTIPANWQPNRISSICFETQSKERIATRLFATVASGRGV